MDRTQFKNTTIVPVDFMESSHVALEHAATIANVVEHKHQITLLHILEGVSLKEPYFEGSELPENTNHALMIEGAELRIKKLIENTFSETEHVNYIIASGKVYSRVAELAKELDSEMIVMGSHGSNSTFQGLLGSNASRVIQLAPCPTVVIRGKHVGEGYKKIVLPLDTSYETKQKVNWARTVGKYFNAHIMIMTVSQDDESVEKRVRNNINQVATFLKDAGLETSEHYLAGEEGNWADQTLKFARDNDADLIMIMTQQEKSISEYVFGTYAQQIVSKSVIPVMAINPRAGVGNKFAYRGIGG